MLDDGPLAERRGALDVVELVVEEAVHHRNVDVRPSPVEAVAGTPDLAGLEHLVDLGRVHDLPAGYGDLLLGEVDRVEDLQEAVLLRHLESKTMSLIRFLGERKHQEKVEFSH